ncbi:MAG: TetR/AcrR family transcriptional regulator [Nocardioidaceae bacterium]
MPDVRQRVLTALRDIIAERGLDQVTVREVAAAAGVSIGAVQYHCPTKDDMLRLALQDMNERIRERVARVEGTGAVRSVLRGALLEFLPLDEQRSREARIYIAFAARAAVSPYLADIQHEALAELRGLAEQTFALAVDSGAAYREVDPTLAAHATVVLTDGLTLQLLTDPRGFPVNAAVALIDAHLDRYFGSPAKDGGRAGCSAT